MLPKLARRLTLVAAGTLLMGLAGPTVVGSADPPAGVTPATTDIVGSGSDASQGLMDQLSSDYNPTGAANRFYSWDAVGTSTITPKSTCISHRPDAGRDGIATMAAGAIATGGAYCFDFAGTVQVLTGGTSGRYVAFAQDGVTWASTSSTAVPSNAPFALSLIQLRAIYSCDASLLNSSYSGPVRWFQVGGTSTHQVVPVVLQSNSDTAATFYAAIGITPSSIGGCAIPTSSSAIQANEGTDPIFSAANSADLIVPYSIGDYLAQAQNGHGTGQQGNEVLKAISTSSSVITPTVGSSPNQTINPALAATGMLHNVYNLVRNVSNNVPPALQILFGHGSNTGYICTNPTAQNDILSYGFRLLGTACGGQLVGQL